MWARMSDSAVLVDLQYGDEIRTTQGLPDKGQLEKWIAAAMENVPRGGVQLTVRIVGTQEGGRLNETYRGKKGPTNVLSFPFEHPGWMEPPLLGDVVICAGRVEEEAREQGKTLESHWAHLVIHGVLHLQGYDHETEQQAAEMEGRERVVMAGLGYADPYAAEVSAHNPVH